MVNKPECKRLKEKTLELEYEIRATESDEDDHDKADERSLSAVFALCN